MLFKFISKFFIFNLSEKIVNAIQMGSITLRIFFIWKFTRFFLFSFELSMTHPEFIQMIHLGLKTINILLDYIKALLKFCKVVHCNSTCW